VGEDSAPELLLTPPPWRGRRSSAASLAVHASSNAGVARSGACSSPGRPSCALSRMERNLASPPRAAGDGGTRVAVVVPGSPPHPTAAPLRGLLRTSRFGDEVEVRYAASLQPLPAVVSSSSSSLPHSASSERPGGATNPLAAFILGRSARNHQRPPPICIQGERACIFSSSLSSKEKCIATLPALLDTIFVMHSVNWWCKNAIANVIGLSLNTALFVEICHEFVGNKFVMTRTST
jgi:hypothetical protein